MPVMQDALSLYDRMGFARTEPHSELGGATGAVYIRLPLLRPAGLE
jgi:hypothetical protein